MYLKKSTNSKTGRTQLSAVEGYYDPKTKNSRTRTIETFGFLDVLQEKYDDPISHFKEVVAQMDKKKKEEQAPIEFSVDFTKQLPQNTDCVRNYGYLAASSIYHQLGIDEFFGNRQRNTKAEYNLNSIFRVLVYSRIIDPASKKASYEGLGKFFDKCDFSLDDVYRSLDIFASYQRELLIWMHEHVTEHYGRDTSLVYYDVTNYYFEVDDEDEMKRRGCSKENRKSPIVQMGLFMDRNALPVTYGLFSGNTVDSQTLIPMMGEIVDEYNLGKVIVVADKGMITGDNIAQIILDNNGYVFSLSIRGAEKEFKDYVLDESGYRKSANEPEGFKIKSRLSTRNIWVTNPLTGKKKKVPVEEKHVVFYSPDYARRAKHERDMLLEKARSLIKDPSKYTKATGYGAAKYVKNISFDKSTGEIIVDKGKALLLDSELVAEEEIYDGYYAIVTSEYKLTDNEIIDIYRGLWEIEETFMISKSELETRPVYLKTTEHVKAHFLICFVALLITRLLEYRIKRKYPVRKIIESMRKCNYVLLEKNIYHLSYRDDVMDELGKDLNIDFSKQYMSLMSIKSEIAKTKR